MGTSGYSLLHLLRDKRGHLLGGCLTTASFLDLMAGVSLAITLLSDTVTAAWDSRWVLLGIPRYSTTPTLSGSSGVLWEFLGTASLPGSDTGGKIQNVINDTPRIVDVIAINWMLKTPL